MVKKGLSVRDISYIGISVCLLAICSFINIPLVVPFTLQTFAIFFIVLFLGPFKSLIALISWILLGICGVPVFANFKAGIEVIMGPTGGYIIGFLFTPLMYLLIHSIFKKTNRYVTYYISMFLGLLICYLFGTLWFVYVYSKGSQTILHVLNICVFPFIIPDLGKMVLGSLIGFRVVQRMSNASYKPLNKYLIINSKKSNN